MEAFYGVPGSVGIPAMQIENCSQAVPFGALLFLKPPGELPRLRQEVVDCLLVEDTLALGCIDERPHLLSNEAVGEKGVGPVIPKHIDELHVAPELRATQQAILCCLEAKELVCLFPIGFGHRTHGPLHRGLDTDIDAGPPLALTP